MERELAAFVAPCAGARAISFSSGYLANLAILSALADRGGAVFADRLNHACLNDGALRSARFLVCQRTVTSVALARRLQASAARDKPIATDAVFSMDGDMAPLAELLALAETRRVARGRRRARLRRAGRGRGSLAHFGIESERVVYMGTLGKAAGVAGAFVAAHPLVIETILQSARPYVYTTAAPALLAEATRASLAINRDDHARRRHLHALVARFRSGAASLPWTLMPSLTAIQPLVCGAPEVATALAARLRDRGFWVPAIRPPTVPAGTARLRVSISAAHGADDVDALLAALAACAP